MLLNDLRVLIFRIYDLKIWDESKTDKLHLFNKWKVIKIKYIKQQQMRKLELSNSWNDLKVYF